MQIKQQLFLFKEKEKRPYCDLLVIINKPDILITILCSQENLCGATERSDIIEEQSNLIKRDAYCLATKLNRHDSNRRNSNQQLLFIVIWFYN